MTFQLQHVETRVPLASPINADESAITTMNLALKRMGASHFYFRINAPAPRGSNPTTGVNLGLNTKKLCRHQPTSAGGGR